MITFYSSGSGDHSLKLNAELVNSFVTNAKSATFSFIVWRRGDSFTHTIFETLNKSTIKAVYTVKNNKTFHKLCYIYIYI